ncbi:hypothetical protein [Streptomyces sp. bgisy154]|uniref:hypothetical protein n=1 Tax=Streptomyces sp. bgisy154 TaxID=3413794 RepID=UPI003D724E17
MPDWTYHPLRGATAALLGRRRSQRTALRLLARIGSRPAGARLIARGFGHRHPPVSLAGEIAGAPLTVRLGIRVPPSLAHDTVHAMAPLGAGVVEIGPVSSDDVPAVRAATATRTLPVVVHTDDPEIRAALAPHVDGFTGAAEDRTPGEEPGPAISQGVRRSRPVGPAIPHPFPPKTPGRPATGPPGAEEPAPADRPTAPAPPRVVRVGDPCVEAAAAVLAEPGAVVIARPEVLVEAGPGWFARVVEAATPSGGPAPGWRDVGRHPRRWPAWWWALLVGLGMITAGVCAAAITLGPVLLWYDRDYLGMTLDDLHAVNHHLVHFLQHDRITMAGTLVSIGTLYTGLAVGGMRRGRPWAREVLLLSGAVGFPTLFYFLATGYVETLHTAAAVMLLPMFLAAVRRRPHAPPHGRRVPDGPERERRRALVGQLLLVVTGAGLFVGGAVISAVGLTGVFVPTDLTYLGTDPRALEAANSRLVPFIAHDRAGFGGALMSAAVAIVPLAAWGWRRGESWVFWTLAVAGATGFLPAVVVHGSIHYTDFVHLAPVYFGIVLTAVGLLLSRPYLCARR